LVPGGVVMPKTRKGVVRRIWDGGLAWISAWVWFYTAWSTTRG